MAEKAWKEQKKEIWIAIKHISDHYGGDDEAFLNQYFEDVIAANKGDLEKAIICFNSLVEQTKLTKPRNKECSI